MLEEDFVRPDTVDRIRASWMRPEVERCVAWLAGQGYRPRGKRMLQGGFADPGERGQVPHQRSARQMTRATPPGPDR